MKRDNSIGSIKSCHADILPEENPRDFETTKEDGMAMEMDYDNLMAYFENLKESTA